MSKFSEFLEKKQEDQALQLIKNKLVKKIDKSDIDLILSEGYNNLFREIVKQTVQEQSVFSDEEKINIFEYIKTKFNPLGDNQICIPNNDAYNTLVNSFTPEEFGKVLTYFRIKHTYYTYTYDESKSYLVTTQLCGKESLIDKTMDIPKVCKIELSDDHKLYWVDSHELVNTSRPNPVWAVNEKGVIHINS